MPCLCATIALGTHTLPIFQGQQTSLSSFVQFHVVYAAVAGGDGPTCFTSLLEKLVLALEKSRTYIYVYIYSCGHSLTHSHALSRSLSFHSTYSLLLLLLPIQFSCSNYLTHMLPLFSHFFAFRLAHTLPPPTPPSEDNLASCVVSFFPSSFWLYYVVYLINLQFMFILLNRFLYIYASIYAYVYTFSF